MDTTPRPSLSKKSKLISLGLLFILLFGLINPFERLAKMRDNDRMLGVESLVDALGNYYLKKDGRYPTNQTSDWMSALSRESVLKRIPPRIEGWRLEPCKAHDLIAEQNNYCYVVDDLDSPTLALLYTKLESSFYYSKCAQYGPSYYPYYLWSSLQGFSGVSCHKADPTDLFVDFRFEK